ncbi:hypothetical protein [Thalassobacillus sp. C254]
MNDEMEELPLGEVGELLIKVLWS